MSEFDSRLKVTAGQTGGINNSIVNDSLNVHDNDEWLCKVRTRNRCKAGVYEKETSTSSISSLSNFEVDDNFVSLGLALLQNEESYSVLQQHSEPRAHLQLVSNKLQSSDSSSSHFLWATFFKEFFYHTFYPFSIPACLYFEGWNYAVNHSFVGFSSWFQVVVSILMLAFNFSFIFGNIRIPFVEVAMANVLYMVHRVMVASKYGFMEVFQVEDLHSRVFTTQENADNELIGGWLEPSETLCNRELNSAAALLGFDLSKIVFHVNMTPQEIADFLLIKIYEHASISTVNPKLQCVCLRGTLTRIVLDTTSSDNGAARQLIRMLGIVQALMGPMIRYYYGENLMFDNVMSVITAACVFWITYFFYYTEILFVYVGIMDYLRHAQLLVAMAVLIDPSDISVCLKDDLLYKKVSKNIPWVDLSVSENVVAWAVARQVLRNFGMQYRKRISLYTSLTSLLVVVMLLMLLTLKSKNGEGISLIGSQILLVLVFYNLAVLLTCISLMIFFGSRANDSYWIHRGTLARIQMAIRERNANMDVDFGEKTRALTTQHDRLNDSDKLIDAAKELLLVDNETAPVTILGMKATTALINSIFTLSGSVVTLAMQSYAR